MNPSNMAPWLTSMVPGSSQLAPIDLDEDDHRE
jgi:hypothetical protein